MNVSFIADDAGSFRAPANLPCDEPTEHDILVVMRDESGLTEDVKIVYRSYLGVPVTLDEALPMIREGLFEEFKHRNFRLISSTPVNLTLEGKAARLLELLDEFKNTHDVYIEASDNGLFILDNKTNECVEVKRA